MQKPHVHRNESYVREGDLYGEQRCAGDLAAIDLDGGIDLFHGLFLPQEPPCPERKYCNRRERLEEI